MKITTEKGKKNIRNYKSVITDINNIKIIRTQPL